MQQEIHPWNWYVPAGAKTVIIGTFPPTLRNWSYDFFYPNTNNRFWKIMAHLDGHVLTHFAGEEAVAERKTILDHLEVGLSDMGQVIRRTSDSSLDENLNVVEYMDILRLLDENPSINKILFTSSSGKSNAVRWFKDYLAVRKIHFTIPKGQRPVRRQITLNKRTIEIVLLYSTSPRVGSIVSLDQLTELFGNEICIHNH
jgi:G:T/U-mismatch repair DNA glycosylase